MIDTLLPDDRAVWRGWAGVRVVLAGLSVVVAAVIAVVGVRSVSFGDLQSEVLAGKVSRVEVIGGLLDGGQGYATQQIRWEGWWFTRTTEVIQASGTSVSDADRVVLVNQDAADVVTGWDPSVEVVRNAGQAPSSSLEVAGFIVPGWVLGLGLVQALGALILLVQGPDPWWGTRWGWFWLFALPLGPTAFLLLGGPLPGAGPAAPSRRRLTGGWAFLIALVL